MNRKLSFFLFFGSYRPKPYPNSGFARDSRLARLRTKVGLGLAMLPYTASEFMRNSLNVVLTRILEGKKNSASIMIPSIRARKRTANTPARRTRQIEK